MIQQPITQEDALSAQHRAWLAHPTTQQLLSNIDSMRNSNIKCLVNLHGNTPEDATYALKISHGIRTLEAIKICITDTEKFLEQLTK